MAVSDRASIRVYGNKMNESAANIIDIVSAIGSFGAAVSGGIAAWISLESTKAAKATVEEAREARRMEVLPRFTLERNFLDLAFNWPEHFSPGRGASFFGRRPEDYVFIPATLCLENHGQGPAIEVRVIFELIDNHGSFDLPAGYDAIGLSVIMVPGDMPSLQFMQPDGSGWSVPLYRRMRVDFPHLAPGTARDVKIPDQIVARILARGLQNRGIPKAKDMTLIVYVQGYTSEGELVVQQFRYCVSPFAYGPGNPMSIHSHVHDLHMFDRDSSTIAALV